MEVWLNRIGEYENHDMMVVKEFTVVFFLFFCGRGLFFYALGRAEACLDSRLDA